MLGTIDPTSDRPVYRQIADNLRRAINEGQIPEDGILPSETNLAKHYDVTRVTARHAVDVLKSEGLVYSEHGRGVFVRKRMPIFRSTRNRFSRAYREAGRGAYDVEMKARGLVGKTELDLDTIKPPEIASSRLTLQPGEKVVMRRRRMYASDQPTQLATSYIPSSLAEPAGINQPDTGSGGLYSRLTDIGHGPAYFTEEVATRITTPEETRFFKYSSPQPILYVVRTAFDNEDNGVEICEHIMAGNLWTLSYEWSAE